MRPSARQRDVDIDAAYRTTTKHLGIAMLTFLGLFLLLGFLPELVILFLPTEDLSLSTRHVIEELCGSAVYLLSFMIPVLVFHKLTPPHERLPMRLSPKLPRRTPMIVLASVAIIYMAAIANALLLRVLGWSNAYGSDLDWALGIPAYQGILMLISTAMVPAFCEELLFRGTALTALRPFGKTTAVLGSAVLFGLMHGTADQILYTMVAGIVLALATIESGSMWISVLIHLFNNLFSTIENILHMRFATERANLIYGVLELLVIGGGLLCLVYLMTHRTEDTTQEREETVPRHPVRGFLTLPMLAFVIVSLLQMLLFIL